MSAGSPPSARTDPRITDNTLIRIAIDLLLVQARTSSAGYGGEEADGLDGVGEHVTRLAAYG
ncbi:hypothetical protein ACIRIR_35610 [Streptomyces globisporus]|uniref:hypothetical protein n=1 Tax=Streptomyces globisporus TaxID=1908 RepID=UPI0037FA49A6